MKRLYTARQLERLTGVPAHTFRAWERRFGVPLSITDEETGVILYPEQSVEFVKWTRMQVAKGLRIAEAILLVRASGQCLRWDYYHDQ